MTAQEKQKIASLSEKGLGYRKIAAQIGIFENTVKSYLKRMTAADDQKEPDQPAAVFSCPQCGLRTNPSACAIFTAMCTTRNECSIRHSDIRGI